MVHFFNLFIFYFFAAYVSGERGGLIQEHPFKMGETLNGTFGLDIEEEKRVMEERLNELQSEGATQEAITLAMKDLAMQRSVLLHPIHILYI